MDSPEIPIPHGYTRLLLFASSHHADKLEPEYTQPSLPIAGFNDDNDYNYEGIPILLQFDISGKYILPGGRIEGNETPDEGLVREIREEHPAFNFTSEYLNQEVIRLQSRPWSSGSPNHDWPYMAVVDDPGKLKSTNNDTLFIFWADFQTCKYFFQTKQMPQNIWELIKQGYESLRL